VIEDWFVAIAGSPWLFPALFGLVVVDAFLVIVPSETAVVALGALAGSTGMPPLAILIPVAAVGAIVGDSLCFGIGRTVGVDRWRWQRGPRIARALARVQHGVLVRPAVLIFTARYIPFARIAVNLTAGAVGLPYRRFLPLSAAAGSAWAIYNVGVGLTVGAVLRDNPVLAIIISVVIAVGLGLLVDAIASRISARRARLRGDALRPESPAATSSDR
jgi:membrane protein DedA with SNARE-associated domain